MKYSVMPSVTVRQCDFPSVPVGIPIQFNDFQVGLASGLIVSLNLLM